MSKTHQRVLLFASALALVGGVACSAAPAASSATADLEAEEAVSAPKLESVAAMSGALHVKWSADDACETIHAERKADMEGMEDYEHAFAVPAEAGNKMDNDATHPATYTYRLRCEKNGKFSKYSNERSAKPGG